MRDYQLRDLTGGELLCHLLASNKVDHIFGYPGGAALPLFDGIYKTDLFRFILAHHEQGAGHMAEGYASASGKPGTVLVTSGPGTSNLTTPMLDALMDGRPMVVVCGQVSTAAQGTNAFQEIDTMALSQKCCKWSAFVERIDDMPKIVHKAFHQSISKRPGPVLITIPVDIGKKIVKSAKFDLCGSLMTEEYKISENDGRTSADIENRRTMQQQIDKVENLLRQSERPVICAGHGVILSQNGCVLLSQLANKFSIPVTTTLLGLGSFDETHELALHMLGTYGSPYANYAIQNADLILVLGARLDDRVVGNPEKFALGAKEASRHERGGIVHFDINPDMVGKLIKPTQIVSGDLTESLSILLSRVQKQENQKDWLSQIQQWKKCYTFKDSVVTSDSYVTPQQVMSELNRQSCVSKDRITITTGVGQHQMWAAQRYRYTNPRSLITSGSLGTMGFGLPAAIGAQVAGPDRTVIDIDGDASFCMTMEELLTACQHDLPIKIIVFNNNTQAMIAQIQRASYEGRACFNSQANPDFVQLADSMGCECRRCWSSEDIRGSIWWLLRTRGPAMLEVRIDDEVEMFPIVPAGEALDQISLGKPSYDDYDDCNASK